MTNPNRHLRRKAAVTDTVTPAELQKLDTICSWEGCEEIADLKGGTVYLPKGWTALLMFWSLNAVQDFRGLMTDADMQRDGVLCPKHTAAIQLQLKSLNREEIVSQ